MILKERNSYRERRVAYELTEQERGEIKFTSGRVNLIALIIITVANIAFFIFGQSYLVPFSASIPFYAVAYSYIGPYLPAALGWPVAILSIGAFIICWVRAKDDWRWLMGAFALVTLDTIAFFFIASKGLAVFFWPDLFFHAWMLYYLSNAVRFGRKLDRFAVKAVRLDNED